MNKTCAPFSFEVNKPVRGWLWLATLMGLISFRIVAQITNQPGLVSAELIFSPGSAPFAQCHASTIVETKGNLVAAWFGGTAERNPDVGIWYSRREQGHWSAPVELATGTQETGPRYACWNPVLFQPAAGPLLLFYKVGPSPSRWWGMMMSSGDGGNTWSQPVKLPLGILGPIKNKPVQLATGDILCGSSTEDHGWRVHFERTADFGRTWMVTGAVGDAAEFAVIQPTILRHGDGRLQALARSKQGKIVETWSSDSGRAWGKMRATQLPNPNSGIDGVTISDGRQLLVYNHSIKGRTPLNVAVSSDGREWSAALVLEDGPGEFSYPAAIQSSDGLVHSTYTWKRVAIKHVVIDPKNLRLTPLPP